MDLEDLGGLIAVVGVLTFVCGRQSTHDIIVAAVGVGLGALLIVVHRLTRKGKSE